MLRKITSIQALVRGRMARRKHAEIVLKIRRDAPKRTTKYQKISRLQAHLKGFLFRNRRRKLLAQVTKASRPLSSKHDLLDDLDDFDAEEFFGIKEDQLEAAKQ